MYIGRGFERYCPLPRFSHPSNRFPRHRWPSGSARVCSGPSSPRPGLIGGHNYRGHWCWHTRYSNLECVARKQFAPVGGSRRRRRVWMTQTDPTLPSPINWTAKNCGETSGKSAVPRAGCRIQKVPVRVRVRLKKLIEIFAVCVCVCVRLTYESLVLSSCNTLWSLIVWMYAFVHGYVSWCVFCMYVVYFVGQLSVLCFFFWQWSVECVSDFVFQFLNFYNDHSVSTNK